MWGLCIIGRNTCSWSAPQECSTAYWGQGMGRGAYRFGNVSGKSHVIEWDQIVMTGMTGMIE